MSDNFRYNSNVSQEEFDKALANLHKAILEKDTPEEWARFTGKILIGVGKLTISHLGFGPAISLLEEVFGDEHELIDLLKLLGENDENV